MRDEAENQGGMRDIENFSGGIWDEIVLAGFLLKAGCGITQFKTRSLLIDEFCFCDDRVCSG